MDMGSHTGFATRFNAPGALPVMVFSLVGFIFVAIGTMCANMGRWTDSIVGFLGISLIISGVILLVMATYRRSQLRSWIQGSRSTDTAGIVHQNVVVPQMTIQSGITTPSQAGGTTSYVIETRGMQSAGVTVGTQDYNTQQGYTESPTSAQTYPHPMQNFAGTPHHPPQNGAFQYPSSHINSSGAPQVHYAPVHHPPSAGNHLGVVEPVTGENGLPPPPSYNDLFASK